MAMVHEPRHRRAVCTPQGNALCFGISIAALVLAAVAIKWLFSLIVLL